MKDGRGRGEHPWEAQNTRELPLLGKLAVDWIGEVAGKMHEESSSELTVWRANVPVLRLSKRSLSWENRFCENSSSVNAAEHTIKRADHRDEQLDHRRPPLVAPVRQ